MTDLDHAQSACNAAIGRRLRDGLPDKTDPFEGQAAQLQASAKPGMRPERTAASIDRIRAAVELNPDRLRVTLRREDARQLLAENQRLAADVERYKTGAIELEAMCVEHCATIRRLRRERDGFQHLAEQRRLAAAPLIHPLAHLPHAWALYVACTFAGVLVGRG